MGKSVDKHYTMVAINHWDSITSMTDVFCLNSAITDDCRIWLFKSIKEIIAWTISWTHMMKRNLIGGIIYWTRLHTTSNKPITSVKLWFIQHYIRAVRFNHCLYVYLMIDSMLLRQQYTWITSSEPGSGVFHTHALRHHNMRFTIRPDCRFTDCNMQMGAVQKCIVASRVTNRRSG